MLPSERGLTARELDEIINRLLAKSGRTGTEVCLLKSLQELKLSREVVYHAENLFHFKNLDEHPFLINRVRVSLEDYYAFMEGKG